MNRTHTLKLHVRYWDAVMRGFKSFELRKLDRPYEFGDYIHFVKVNRDGKLTDDKKNLFQIVYILEDVPQYGLSSDYCILGIQKVES